VECRVVRHTGKEIIIVTSTFVLLRIIFKTQNDRFVENRLKSFVEIQLVFEVRQFNEELFPSEWQVQSNIYQRNSDLILAVKCVLEVSCIYFCFGKNVAIEMLQHCN
jgi:hypothetical protein